MHRKTFIRNTAGATAAVFLSKYGAGMNPLPDDYCVRIPADKRNFTSEAVEAAIKEFKANVKNKELACLFENCFPNTLDTTVFYSEENDKPDTYVITGDIDAMWLRDSSAQVWPYLPFCKQDNKLRKLVAGVINRQTRCIIKDPYANAFYHEPDKKGEWFSDHTDMKPGVHERKWEIDSLCYPIRLGYNYWKTTGDASPFDAEWDKAIESIYNTFIDQQRKNGRGNYHFQRTTAVATDTQPMSGYGYPVKPVGLICSAFRPSDDATVYSYLIPSNFFAVVSLRQAAEMLTRMSKDKVLANKCKALASEVERALQQHAVVTQPGFGKIYAYEVNGFGSYNLMDDANVPSLLAMPYLGAIKDSDPVYAATRKFVLSSDNPFYFSGSAASGIGGPHVGMDMIWPMAITMRGLTSNNDEEIRDCIETLRSTHAGTGFMHEAFHKDDPAKFTRSWFAWANTLFGEFLWKTYKEKPALLT